MLNVRPPLPSGCPSRRDFLRVGGLACEGFIMHLRYSLGFFGDTEYP